MKKSILPILVALALASGLSSCKKTIDNSGDPELYSFGFYQAYNEGNLYNDYCVDVGENDSIVRIELPYKADITFLVPSFEMSEDDSAYVNDTYQKTNKSGHDFSSPVVYAVRDGTNYAYYTVVVTKADPLSWSTSATFPLGVSEIKAAIDTLTGYPVAAISGTDGYLYYLTYDGTALSAEKITMDGSAVKGTDVGLAFSRTALPYISYLDEDSDLCVIYKTTGWQYAGRKIDRDCEHTGSALGFTPDNKLAVFASDSVSICDVTTWQKPHGVGNPYFSLHGVYPNIVKAGSGLDVVYRSSESNGGISICRYTGFEWSVLADDFCQPNSAGGNSTMQVGTFGIDTDPSGDILMAVNNDCEGTGLRQRVLVYDNVTGSITQLGGYVDEGFDGNSISDIAVSYSNDIYHLYTIRNAVGELYPYVSEYDKADGVWSDGLSMNSQPIVAADMVVNDDGQLYVFTVGRDHNVVLSALE